LTVDELMSMPSMGAGPRLMSVPNEINSSLLRKAPAWRIFLLLAYYQQDIKGNKTVWSLI